MWYHTDQSIFVSCGRLLTYLCLNSVFKVVPNPPSTFQASIDNDIKSYQNILDEIDIEIQLSRRYILRAIEEKQKEEKLREQMAQNGVKHDEIDEKHDGANSGGNGNANNDNDKIADLIDSNMIFDDLFDSKDVDSGNQPTSTDLNDKNGGNSVGDVGDFNGDQFGGNLDEFEDLSALLGESNDNIGEADRNKADEDIGGLFGDNFDFILPGT